MVCGKVWGMVCRMVWGMVRANVQSKVRGVVREKVWVKGLFIMLFRNNNNKNNFIGSTVISLQLSQRL